MAAVAPITSTGGIRSVARAPLANDELATTIDRVILDVPADRIGHALVLADSLPVPHVCAGGYFSDALLGREPKDLDVFFGAEDDWCQAIVWAKESGLQLRNASPMSVRVGPFSGIDLDLVRRAWYPPQDGAHWNEKTGRCDKPGKPDAARVLHSFDFHACMIGWDGQSFWAHANAVSDTLAKQIVLTSQASKRPTSSLMHVGRYVHKGFKIHSRYIFQLAEARRHFEVNGLTEDDWQS